VRRVVPAVGHAVAVGIAPAGAADRLAYQIGPDSIAVKFRDGRVYYFYTHASTGQAHVEAMKQLGAAGRGLGTYISRRVQMAYATRSS
jgi:hypothetical protein